MVIQATPVRVALALLLATITLPCMAQTDSDMRYLHAYLGWSSPNDAWSVAADNSTTGTADIEKLYRADVIGQFTRSTGPLEFGYETGGGLAFTGDRHAFWLKQENGELSGKVRIESQFWLVNLYLGAFASYRFGHGVRAFAAAGPYLGIASANLQREQLSTAENNQSDTSTKQALDLSPYARVGLIYTFQGDATVGLTAQWTDNQWDFDEYGEIKINQLQWLLTLGRTY
ncbi:hypothetical protein [Halioxenophilus sp. WMMB6]|uniref:hypothetical protein n=1 Tax=Halioxenophilus sp. WMMB6 TaxID=3073815 RepID=UPI00295F29F4|nr:hypothetical protein [Halioxenophilus sp. WMMB6]